MHHFFIEQLINKADSSLFEPKSRAELLTINLADYVALLEGANYHHLARVLRAKLGEAISLALANQIIHGQITAINDTSIEIGNLKLANKAAELPVDLYLVQGLPKQDKLEFIITKACELGASAIIPLACARSVSKENNAKQQKKAERRQEIALAACQQAKRAKLVEVKRSLSWEELFKNVCCDYWLLAYEAAPKVAALTSWWQKQRDLIVDSLTLGDKLSSNKESSTSRNLRIGILIGPEGGFSESEVAYAKAHGAELISLGERILRTETAGLTVLSYLMLELNAINTLTDVSTNSPVDEVEKER